MAELSAEKRILLAFGLSFVVLILWSKFFLPKPEPEGPEIPSAATEQAKPPESAPPPTPEPAAAPAPSFSEPRQGSTERLITVETNDATIVLSNHGAGVRSWRLKNYLDDKGEPVELVQSKLTGLGYPLTLSLADTDREKIINDALYAASPEEDTLQAPAEAVFEWSDGHLAVRKRIRFEDDYRVEVETEVLEDGQPVEHRLAWRGGFGETADQAASGAIAGSQVFVRGPAKLLVEPAQAAGKGSGWLWKYPSPFPFSGEAAYAGIDDRYFAAIFLPRRPELRVNAWTQPWTPEDAKKPVEVGQVAVGVPNHGNALRLYVGPKDLDLLKQIQTAPLAGGVQPDLADELVDFGWFWWVAKPLFAVMKWMHSQWVPNYGWVIVLLTVVINLVLFPMRWKSMESSFKMQKVQPQVKAIQERYKQYKFNDPRKQQMQAEIMEIYRQHGINPVGGCLPLLLQLPVFYGFYKVLALSIEMRHAPWILWIVDLSQKDPYYVLPVGMAASMYASTSLTPMTGDPRQKRMMQIMMLFFAFLFFQMPAGLVLYWLASGLVGLGQQVWINRRLRGHEAERKEAERAGKKKKRRREAGAEG